MNVFSENGAHNDQYEQYLLNHHELWNYGINRKELIITQWYKNSREKCQVQIFIFHYYYYFHYFYFYFIIF